MRCGVRGASGSIFLVEYRPEKPRPSVLKVPLCTVGRILGAKVPAGRLWGPIQDQETPWARTDGSTDPRIGLASLITVLESYSPRSRKSANHPPQPSEGEGQQGLKPCLRGHRTRAETNVLFSPGIPHFGQLTSPQPFLAAAPAKKSGT